MKRTFFFTLALLVACCAVAQQAPQWVFKTPKAGNDTYLYVCEQGIGYSQQEAYNIALTRVFQSTSNRIGQPFDSQKLETALRNGTPLEVISRNYNIPINKICEYPEKLPNGNYRVYVLCQVAKAGNIVPQWDSFSKCYDRGGEERNGMALFKSMFVPGLGQIGKGYVGEGVFTLVGELALVGGAVGCYYIAQDQLNIMRDPMVNYENFITARQNYNTLQTTSYILWGTAGALYVFNLIRAVSAKPKFKDGIAFTPTLIPSESNLTPGVSLTFNF